MNNILTYNLFESNKKINKELYNVFGKSIKYLYNNDTFNLADNSVTKIELNNFYSDYISRLKFNLLIVKNTKLNKLIGLKSNSNTTIGKQVFFIDFINEKHNYIDLTDTYNFVDYTNLDNEYYLINVKQKTNYILVLQKLDIDKEMIADIKELYKYKYKIYWKNKYKYIQKLINEIIDNIDDYENEDVNYLNDLNADLRFCKIRFDQGIDKTSLTHFNLPENMKFIYNLDKIERRKYYDMLYKEMLDADKEMLIIERNKRFSEKAEKNPKYYFSNKHTINDKRIIKKFLHYHDANNFDLI